MAPVIALFSRCTVTSAVEVAPDLRDAVTAIARMDGSKYHGDSDRTTLSL
jgi:hypothetical protein